MINFKEVYEKSLIDAQTIHIKSSNFSSKPIMAKGIISPESTICIQPTFCIEFELDKSGMNTIIEMLENKWNAKTEKEKKNLLSVLTDVYSITEEYLGGHGVPEIRQKAYFESSNNHLNLSEIKGKNIGLCSERAAIGHQILSILEKAGLTDFESFFTNSYITVDTREEHSFIILKHKNDSSKQYIFDIENPLKYKTSEEAKPNLGIALYPMTEEEYQAFKSGKSISPQSIYEQFGMSVVSAKRFYGDEEHNKEKETELQK